MEIKLSSFSTLLFENWLNNVFLSGPPPKLHEMDPNTKEYWILARKLAQMNQQRLVRIKLLRMKYANREDKKK